VDCSDNRKYLKLADREGWVPECSRKDASRPVVVEVGVEPAPVISMKKQEASWTIPEEPNEDESNVDQNTADLQDPEVQEKLQARLRKTKVCGYWKQGYCKNGNSCIFAHGESEIQERPTLLKTSICKAWQQGTCTDPDCKFAHGKKELRKKGVVHKTVMCKWFLDGTCRSGENCRYAHSPSELRQSQDPVDIVEKKEPITVPSEDKIAPVSLSAPPGLDKKPNVDVLKATVSTLTMQCNQLRKQVQFMYTPETGKTPLKSAAKPFVSLNANAKTFVPPTPEQKLLTMWQ